MWIANLIIICMVLPPIIVTISLIVKYKKGKSKNA